MAVPTSKQYFKWRRRMLACGDGVGERGQGQPCGRSALYRLSFAAGRSVRARGGAAHRAGGVWLARGGAAPVPTQRTAALCQRIASRGHEHVRHPAGVPACGGAARHTGEARSAWPHCHWQVRAVCHGFLCVRGLFLNTYQLKCKIALHPGCQGHHPSHYTAPRATRSGGGRRRLNPERHRRCQTRRR